MEDEIGWIEAFFFIFIFSFLLVAFGVLGVLGYFFPKLNSHRVVSGCLRPAASKKRVNWQKEGF